MGDVLGRHRRTKCAFPSFGLTKTNLRSKENFLPYRGGCFRIKSIVKFSSNLDNITIKTIKFMKFGFNLVKAGSGLPVHHNF